MQFLSNCRFVLGMKGGSSLIDYRGDITIKVDSFMREYPKATFATVERECFPGEDGKVLIANISPRIFESAIARTCQILIEDDYFDGFNEGTHYISLKRDFSNIKTVISQMNDKNLVKKIVENAYEFLITSGQYSYEYFVSNIFKAILQCNNARIIKLNPSMPVKIMEPSILRNHIAQNLFLYSKKEALLKMQVVKLENDILALQNVVNSNKLLLQELDDIRKNVVKKDQYMIKLENLLQEYDNMKKDVKKKDRDVIESLQQVDNLTKEISKKDDYIIKLECSVGFIGAVKELLGINRYYRSGKTQSNIMIKLCIKLHQFYKVLFV